MRMRLGATAAACMLLALGCSKPVKVVVTPPDIQALGRLQPEIKKELEQATAKLVRDLSNAKKWGNLGMRYEANRIPEQARTCYQEAFRLDDRNALWPYRYAIAAANADDYPEAIEWAQRSADLDSTYAPTQVRIGSWNLELGAIDAAETAFERAKELTSEQPEVWAGLARVALQRDALDLALQHVKTARSLDEETPYWKLLHGTILARLGQDTQALPLLTAGQGSRPTMLDPWSRAVQGNLAKATDTLARVREFEAQKDYTGAIRLLRGLIADRPGEARLPLHLGRTLLEAGRLKEALEVTSATLQDFPTHMEILVLHGGLLDKLGRRGEAWSYATLAMQNHRDRPDGYLLQASLLKGEKRFAEAASAAKTALDLAPWDQRSQMMLAQLYLDNKEPWKTVTLLEPALEDPNFAPPMPYFQILAKGLRGTGREDKLQALAERAQALHGDPRTQNGEQ